MQSDTVWQDCVNDDDTTTTTNNNETITKSAVQVVSLSYS